MSFSFAGKPCCSCQAQWLPAYQRAAQLRGLIPGALHCFQLIGFFGGSGGTHAGGGAQDYAYRPGLIALAREMGADATWYRPFNWDGDGGIEHIHGVLRGCPHLSASARAQIVAVDNGGDGLLGTAPDNGPRPLSGRTWREGIAWALQQEDDMADPATQAQLDRIEAAIKGANDQIGQLRSAETDRAIADRKRDVQIAAALDDLAVDVFTRAGKEQVRRIKELLLAEETA
jgi:hypothetical protein